MLHLPVQPTLDPGPTLVAASQHLEAIILENMWEIGTQVTSCFENSALNTNLLSLPGTHFFSAHFISAKVSSFI